jgi:hypothetical protein
MTFVSAEIRCSTPGAGAELDPVGFRALFTAVGEDR